MTLSHPPTPHPHIFTPRTPRGRFLTTDYRATRSFIGRSISDFGLLQGAVVGLITRILPLRAENAIACPPVPLHCESRLRPRTDLKVGLWVFTALESLLSLLYLAIGGLYYHNYDSRHYLFGIVVVSLIGMSRIFCIIMINRPLAILRGSGFRGQSLAKAKACLILLFSLVLRAPHVTPRLPALCED